MREWKLAIHVSEPYLRFLLFIAFCQVFFPLIFAFLTYRFIVFSLFLFGFLLSFVSSLFFRSCFIPVFSLYGFISSLSQLTWE
jgi:hypothetical protein